ANKESLSLTANSQHLVINLRQFLKQTNSLQTNRSLRGETTVRLFFRTGRLTNVRPQVPRLLATANQTYHHFRQELPIFGFRKQILSAIDSNRVVIISGDTGCGKTTQVPQYLLEDSALNGKPCRIVCCEPRRLAAISVCERICVERNEQIGGTVGYQIRLESRVSNDTLLTFCTNGVILRTLMSNKPDFLRNVTHIIIDEVHERDRFSDFLLLILKQTLKTDANIKLILMSATFNIKKFEDYFECESPVIEIPGRQHPVDEYFLEDVLKATNYMTLPMARYKQILDNQKRKQQTTVAKSGSAEPPVPKRAPEVESQLKQAVDLLLKGAWVEGTDEAFDKLLDFVSQNSFLIDHKHSETGVTALVCASGHNKLQVVEALVCFGADVSVRTPNDMTAYDWAQYFGHNEVGSYLSSVSDDKSVGAVGNQLTEEEKELLDIYHNCFNDDDIDCQLICAILAHIMRNSSPDGAILVFLPGLDDILAVKDSILSDMKRFNPNYYEIFILHSQMQSSDQKRVFNRLSNSCRKIILSTNIAETSLTIDDVVFVIDLGKVKEKSFDSLMGISSLKSVWISQSSRFQLPEILRIPIHEVCLQTKLLVPNNEMSIHEFLSAAIDPPSIASVRASVQLLKTIDALDSTEQLTQLGVRLLDLPIEPNYGKMLLYSIAFRRLNLFGYRSRVKNRYQSLQRFQLPEILRIPIHEVCLQTKLLVPNNEMSIHEFLSAAIDPPSIASVRASVQLLKTIDALDSTEQLTQLGVRLLDLPIEPNYGKMLLYSIVLKCVEPVLTIVSSFAYRDPFMIPSVVEKQRSLKSIKKSFCETNSFSDHIIYLNAFNRWLELPPNGRHAFCRQNLISNNTMALIDGIRQQILGQLVSAGFIRHNSDEHNRNASNWVAIKAALCAGAYPKLIHFDEELGQFRCQKDKIRFHGSSQLNADPNTDKFVGNYSKLRKIMPTNWYIYEEMILMGRTSYAKTLTAVSTITVALFAGRPAAEETQPVAVSADLDSVANLQIDDWIRFDSNAQTVKIVDFLKQELHSLFVRQIDSLSKASAQKSDFDNRVVDAVIQVLETEEMATGFGEVDGSGLRPRVGPVIGPQFQPKYESRQYHSNRQFRQQKQRFKENQRYPNY
ncbi:unnamed protein product, partial [Oppiella nova]